MDRESIIFLTIIGFTFIALIVLTNLFSSFTCSMYGKETERETKYTMIGGCYVKTEKGWRQRKELRVED